MATWACTSNGTVAVTGNITGSTLVKGAGVSGTLNYNACGVGATGFATGAMDNTDYYEYAVTPVAGNTLTVTAFQLNNTTKSTLTGSIYANCNNRYYYSTDNFATRTEIGTGPYGVGSTSNCTTAGGWSLNVTVPSGTTFRVRVYAYGLLTTAYFYFNSNVKITGTTASNCTQPTTQATASSNGTITSSSIVKNWVRGNGNNVLVVARLASTTAVAPSSGTAYASPNTIFGSGSTTGTGNYAVYNGTGTTVTVTGLAANTAYSFDVYEYATTGTCYKTPALTTNTTTLCAAFGASPWTVSSNGCYAVPANVTSMTVECWGGGGGSGGARAVATAYGGSGGGGGGAYAKSVLTVSSGQSYTISVGGAGTAGTTAGDNGGAGGVSTVTGTGGTVTAAGGGGGTGLNVSGGSGATARAGGAGGTVAASTGTTRFAGGAGGSGISGSWDNGGGGGSGAGTAQNGVNGTNGAGLSTAPAGGVCSCGGGNGGNAGFYNNWGTRQGSNGTAPGGGGGGSTAASNSGTQSIAGATGGAGRIIITYVSCSPPAAPTGSASQSFCAPATVANLVATGTAIQWYAAASGGSPLAGSTALVNGTHYYASQTVTCESTARFDVTATVTTTPAPTGTAAQSFCGSPTVANLVATGTTVVWFAAATGGTALATSTALSNGTHYYSSQTVGGCASATRFDVTATVNTIPAAPTGTAAQSFCGASTVANLTATGTAIQWYAASTGGSALAAGTALVNGTHYYASQTVGGCESTSRFDVTATITAIPAAPTGTAAQSFCAPSTVANLAATGTAIKWYAASSGGVALLSSNGLTNSTHYYASQTVGGCESTSRFDVTATVTTTAAPTGTAAQSFCGSPTVANLAATGTSVVWFAAATGGSSLSAGTALSNGTHYYGSQTVGGCASATRFDVTATVAATPAAPTGTSAQSFCPGSTVASLAATGTTIQWYAASSGGSALATSTTLVNGTHYYASQTVSGCESTSRFDVTVSVGTIAAPTSATASPANFCNGTSTTIQLNGVSAAAQIRWYNAASGGVLHGTSNSGVNFQPAAISATTTYYAASWNGTCESSTRLAVTATGGANTAPTLDALTVDNSCWIPDNAHNYVITAQASSVAGIGGSTYGILALINYQGEYASANGVTNGGYFAWNTTQALLTAQGFTANQFAATGGGWVGQYATAYGSAAATLMGGTTSVSGNQRTVTFTVRPTTSFPKLIANDISMYSMNSCGTAAGWTNFQTNFGSATVTASASVSPTSVCAGSAVNLTSSASATETARVIYSENFEGFGANAALPTGGWNTFQVTGSVNSWEVTSTTPIGGSARSLSIYNGSTHKSYNKTDNCNKVAYGPLINTSGYNNLKLNFNWQCTGEYATSTYYDYGMAVWSSNGTTWSDISATRYNEQTGSSGSVTNLDISALNGQSFYLGFRWVNDGNSGDDPPFTIDDIVITGVNTAPGPFTYSWTSTPAGFTSSSQNPIANPTVATTYNVVATGGCPSAAASTPQVAVTPVVVPSVSVAITTGTNPACTGTSITFTATPTNGGTTPSYQWKVNGGNVGTNSTTFTTTTLADNDVVTVVMTTNITCPSTPTATSTGITMDIHPLPTLTTAQAAPSSCTVSVSATPSGGATAYWQNTTAGGTCTTCGTSPFTSPQTVSANNTYYYRAYNATTGCWSSNGTVTVSSIVTPATQTANNLVYCAGGTGTTIGLAGSASGVSYQLRSSANANLGTAVSGTGSAISFATYTTAVVAGNPYNVLATNTTSGCTFVISGINVSTTAVPAAPTASVTVQPSCLVSTGTITVTAPTGAYEYSLDGGTYQAGTSFTGVAPGGHTLTTRLAAAPFCVSSPTATLTVNSAPAAPTVPTVTAAYTCSNGSITLTPSALGANESYRWYDAASGGSVVSTANPFSPSITNTTNYYLVKYNSASACESSPRLAVVASIEGLDKYTAARTTGNTYTDISGGTAVSSWRNGSDDSNLSNSLSIGFTFPYDGGRHTQLRVSTNGFITFNTATNATGDYLVSCGYGDAYSDDNDIFTDERATGTLQAIAPFYDELMPNTYALNSSVHYQLSGTSPNQVLTVQWRGMSKPISSSNCSPCSYGNYNFQVKLYETSGNIEFIYSTMNAGGDEYSKSYSCGLNSSSLSSSPTLSQLFTQQSANTATFSASPSNNLSSLPTAASKISFTRTAPVTPSAVPQCILYNYPVNGSTAQCRNTILSWTAVDGVPTGYDVYIGAGSLPGSPAASNLTTTYYNPGTLSASTTYYWKVVPKNAAGTAIVANMPTYTFTTSGGDAVTGITSTQGTTFCVGTTTTLNVQGTLSEGSSYQWTTPFIFDFGCDASVPYPLFDHITNINACAASSRTITYNSPGTYKYYVRVKGCNANTSCVSITITVNDNANTAPTSITSSLGNTVCSGYSPVLTASGGTHGSGAQYEWFTGSCSGTPFATTSGNTVSVAPTANTTYYVRRTGGTTCPNTTSCTSQAIAIQNAIGNNTISSAQTVCSTSAAANLTGLTPTGGNGTFTYAWESSTTSSSSGFGVATGTNNGINYSPGTLTQTTWFKRNVTSGTCSTASESNVVQVTVETTPAVPGAITSSNINCTSFTISWGSAANAAGYEIQVSALSDFSTSISGGYDGSANFGNILTTTVSGAGVNAGSTYYVRVRARNGTTPCRSGWTQLAGTVVTLSNVTMSSQPGNQSTCIGQSTSFVSGTSGGGTLSYQWEVFNGSSWSTISSAGTNPTYSGYNSSATLGLSNITSTAANGYKYRCTISSAGGCTAVTSNGNATLTINPNVGTPSFTLGASSSRCQGAGSVTYSATAASSTGITYSLDATTAAFSGNSIIASTGAVTFAAGWSGTTTVTASAAGCNGPLTATHTVTSSSTPSTSSAGPNQTICSGIVATLAANNASSGTGVWSITSGPSSNLSQFSNTASPSSTFTPAGGPGVYVLRWTIANSPCTASFAEVQVTLNVPATGSTTTWTGANTSGNDNWNNYLNWDNCVPNLNIHAVITSSGSLPIIATSGINAKCKTLTIPSGNVEVQCANCLEIGNP